MRLEGKMYERIRKGLKRKERPSLALSIQAGNKTEQFDWRMGSRKKFTYLSPRTIWAEAFQGVFGGA